ncbi:glycoside hydrolase [Panus rudis PR-1116 ss-1]|nr:glycoside hydrolase [Panus rudis PR-1116 ss-1]
MFFLSSRTTLFLLFSLSWFSNLATLFADARAIPVNGLLRHVQPRVLRELSSRDVDHSQSQSSSKFRQLKASGPNGCVVEPYEVTVALEEFPPFDQTKATIFRYRQQQSVNLGSWFVHEDWMTQSLFKCAAGKKVSELDIAQGWGSQTNARALLERHWDTFINQSDFNYLASIGINTVRMPIGYWNLGPEFCKGTPFESVANVYTGSWPRVVRAINMANEAGIGVLVDLHGAVGSQNGQAHSGISDGVTGLFDSPANIDKTMKVLTFLTKQLASVTNVVGIQMLNEPKGVDSLEDFYTKAISTMRAVSPAAQSLPLYLHDAFDLNRFSKYVASRPDFVVQDHHSYFVFGAQDQRESASQHTSNIKGSVAKSLATASQKQHQNLVVDEWSCALTPGSIGKESNPEQAQKNFCSAQLSSYTRAAAGWSFWAYRKEECNNDPGWCFTAAVGKNLPETFFSYGPSSSSSASSSPIKTLQSTASQTLNPGPRRRSLIKDRLHGRRANTSKGYSDGFQTATIFASEGMSKLGFTGQYIHDSLAKLGKSVDADTYRNDFMKGLADGEAHVQAQMQNN